MRKLFIILTFLCLYYLAFAQKALNQSSTCKSPSCKMVPMPTISYNSDTGLQLGGLIDMYFYGDGSTYPHYKHKLYLDVAWATKGSQYLHLYYDSPSLFKNKRINFAATYKVSSFYPFIGFNGLAAPYHITMDSNKDTKTAYYSINRSMLRVLGNIQGKIYKNLNYVSGLTLWKIGIDNINSKNYDASKSLYSDYIKYNIIDKQEAKGGTHIEAKLGLSYDSRDFEASPIKGIWAEAYFYGSKDFFHHRNDYLKFAFHFRQYINIINKRLVGAYHLAYQGLVAGSAPFYLQSDIATIQLKQVGTDGLGGYNTVRGVLMNRLVGNGYVWGNAELRLRLYSFNIFKQHFDIYTNPFFDMGMVSQSYKLTEMKNSQNPLIYSGKDETMHYSSGLGGKLAINYNFLLSVEVAKAFNKQDGNIGINVGLNYIF